jgi:TM2 domain-containing membrane protein YozV
MNELEMKGPGSVGNVIAALCSVFVPGLGQLVQGRLIMAAVFFVASMLLWCCCLGWVPHIWSIADAALWKDRCGSC